MAFDRQPRREVVIKEFIGKKQSAKNNRQTQLIYAFREGLGSTLSWGLQASFRRI